MKTIIQTWKEFALADLDAAKRLFISKRPTNWTYLLVLWHCHQTVEKGLKMVMIKKNKEIIKIHDLLRLSKLAELTLTKQNKTFLEDLNEFYLRPRYPDMNYPTLPRPSKNSALKYLNKAEKFFLWLEQQ